ncbi:MAG TPA: septum formation initiator family protein [Bryobacteraceae bacterium]|jgi:cell division protein FtsB|nr:septum formation initiator family protein [Bryobacteraceae bacterium]
MPDMLRQYLRPLAALAALVGLAAYAAIMLRGPQGIKAWTEKRHEIQSLEEQNANLQRDINAKKERIEKLKNDPATQELELEKLGLVHKDDTQFKVAGKPGAASKK